MVKFSCPYYTGFGESKIIVQIILHLGSRGERSASHTQERRENPRAH
jgi:hypothetical protein